MNGHSPETKGAAAWPSANRPLSVVSDRVDGGAAGRASDRRRIVVAGTAVTIVEALSVALDSVNGLEVVGLASSEDSLFRLIDGREPDSVVLHAPRSYPEVVESVVRLKSVAGKVRVVLLTERPTVAVMAQIAAAGMATCLPLDTGLLDLVGAVRADTTDTRLVGPYSSATREPAPDAAPASSTAVTLTPRELEVLVLLAEGCSARAIAVHLVVSIFTARGHVKSVLRKLGAHSRLEAVAIATRMGVLPPSGTPRSWTGP
jgi:DNA-binding NarL/FixJ family response regulator